MTLDSRLALDPHIRFRRFDDEGVVIDQPRAEALVLNDTAARVVELSDGARTLGDCIDVMAAEFDARPEAIERDVIAFATDLVDSGIARIES